MQTQVSPFLFIGIRAKSIELSAFTGSLFRFRTCQEADVAIGAQNRGVAHTNWVNCLSYVELGIPFRTVVKVHRKICRNINHGHTEHEG